jgi:hypothetical protein
VQGSLVLFKIQRCLESQFFLLPRTVARAGFRQPEQETRLVWSHGRRDCLFQLDTNLARHLPLPLVEAYTF